MSLSSKTILNELRHLEMSLHDPAVRRDISMLNNLISDDFVEVGASGRRYSKSEIIEELQKELDPLQIWSADFDMRWLSDEMMLLIYTSAHVLADSTKTGHALRSSIWRRVGDSWHLIFHQGTLVAAGAW